MSTNYYLKNKQHHKEYTEKLEWLNNIIDQAISILEPLDLRESALQSIRYKIEDEYKMDSDFRDYEGIHIGKSGGYDFKFEVQYDMYKNTKQDFYKWLDENSGDYFIVNEYEEELSTEEFKQIVDEYGEDVKWINYVFR